MKWSEPAKQDLKQIFDFIARDTDRYAHKVTMEIVDRSEGLGRFPEMGKSLPEMNDPSIRELPIYSYRLIYRVSLSEVVILAIVHSRRELSSESLDDFKA